MFLTNLNTYKYFVSFVCVVLSCSSYSVGGLPIQFQWEHGKTRFSMLSEGNTKTIPLSVPKWTSLEDLMDKNKPESRKVPNFSHDEMKMVSDNLHMKKSYACFVSSNKYFTCFLWRYLQLRTVFATVESVGTPNIDNTKVSFTLNIGGKAIACQAFKEFVPKVLALGCDNNSTVYAFNGISFDKNLVLSTTRM